MTDRKTRTFYMLIALPALLILLFLFILPLSAILSRAFQEGGIHIREVFSSSYTYKVLSFTLLESFLSALLSTLIALPFAYFWANYKFPLRSFILSLSALSFTIPSILVVLGFVIFYGRNGYFNNLIAAIFGDDSRLRILYSFPAIIFAHVYLNLPVAFNLIVNGWRRMNPIFSESSLLLGKSKRETFFNITLPKLWKEISSAFLLIFLFCFSSFSIVLVLGGSPKYTTLEVEIYRRIHISMEEGTACAFALFSFLVTTLLLIAVGRSRRSEGKRNIRIRTMRFHPMGRKEKITAFILVILMLLFILPPMLSIPYRSFVDRNGDFSLTSWEKIFSRSTMNASIVNSLSIALIASTLSVFLSEALALSAARRKSNIIPLLATLPLATGSVTLGLGVSMISKSATLFSVPISYLMIILTHLMMTIPFSLRTILPVALDIPEGKILSSYTLKKSRMNTFIYVEHPMLRGYRKKAFLFAFALSLGEVNATLTLSLGKITTLPVLIYDLIGSYDYQGASALGSVLLAVALLVFLIGGREKKVEK